MKNRKKYLVIIVSILFCFNIFACKDVKNDDNKVIETVVETKVVATISEVSSKNENVKEDIKIEEHKEGKYPINWDLSDLYKNDDEWEKDFNKLESLLKEVDKFKGTINNVDGIYNFIQFNEEGELPTLVNKLYIYVLRNKDYDVTNSTYLNMYSKLNKLSTDYSVSSSFFEDEINKIPIPTLKKYFEDEKLKPYAYYYNQLFDEKRPRYGEEALTVMAKAKSNYGASENVFNAILYADMKNPKVIMPDGTEEEVNDILFDKVKFGDYDREFKEKVESMFYGRYKDHINGLTATLYNQMKEYHNQVLLNNGNEVLADALKVNNIDRSIYDNIVKTTHKILPDFQKYLKLKKEKLAYDKLIYMDVLAPYSKYNASVDYDDAINMIRGSFEILGEEYIKKYDEMVTNKHIDVYPKKNKVEGAYTSTLGNKNIKPFILLNYTGYLNEVKTIAHEIGHAIFACFTEENIKEIPNMDIGIFLHEVASTFNENIFNLYKIDNAKSNEEKLYFIEDNINDINGALIRQILFSEFEDWLYKKVENGDNFVAEELCDKWIELNKEYYGDAVEFTDNMKYGWASIPHFYWNYYVYKYATSITYSTILSNDVYNKKEGALERYLNFLKGGESEEPAKVLSKVGIDVYDMNTYDTMINYYKDIVNQFDELTK